MNIYLYFYFIIAFDVIMGLLMFVDLYQFNHSFLHEHIEAHTHKHTFVISAQEELQELGTGAWLGGAERRCCWRQRPGTKKKRTAHRDLKFRKDSSK